MSYRKWQITESECITYCNNNEIKGKLTKIYENCNLYENDNSLEIMNALFIKDKDGEKNIKLQKIFNDFNPYGIRTENYCFIECYKTYSNNTRAEFGNNSHTLDNYLNEREKYDIYFCLNMVKFKDICMKYYKDFGTIYGLIKNPRNPVFIDEFTDNMIDLIVLFFLFFNNNSRFSSRVFIGRYVNREKKA